MNTEKRILFVQMPWATTHRPSIALGILTRICQKEHVPCKTLYANLDMSAKVGFEVAGRFANERSMYGLSEHLFSVDIFGKDDLMSDKYITAFSNVMISENMGDPGEIRENERDPQNGDQHWSIRFSKMEFLLNLRDQVIPEYLDKMLELVLEYQPDIVGFSATFNQVMSSLALAARIKKANPDIMTIFGGACFDGEMGKEYHRSLPHVVDHVFLGEADESFQTFLKRIKQNIDTKGIPGVTYYEHEELKVIPGLPLRDMDQSPTPDYDDFLFEKERLEQQTGKVFNIEMLPFESSRGCWWGQKNQCVFCGINPELLNFRAKSTERVINDIISLSSRYQMNKFTATDWIISRWHCDEIFQRLIDLDLDLEFFYEVRADLKKDQIMQMYKAGINHVQPGIESFSTPLLKLMKKHSTSLRHIQFLRWCTEVGVRVSYNILAGFPGEKKEWYIEMAPLLRKIVHIHPPLHNMHFVELHRFSPLFEQRSKFNIENFKIRADYDFNFPESKVDTKKAGYFFSFDSDALIPKSEYVSVVKEAIAPWIKAHESRVPPTYYYNIGPGYLQIIDNRLTKVRYLKLSDIYQDITLLCDEVKSYESLKKDIYKLYPEQVKNGDFDLVLQELVGSEILLEEDRFFITLPIGKKPRSTADLRRYVMGNIPEEHTENELMKEKIL